MENICGLTLYLKQQSKKQQLAWLTYSFNQVATTSDNIFAKLGQS
jgi:hypothetical protein